MISVSMRERDHLRINAVKAHLFTPLKLVERDSEPYSLIDWSRLAWGKGDAALITFGTDEGVEGHSGTTPDAAAELVANKARLVGADPFDRLEVETSFRWSSHALSALDIGLWDLAGKKLELPVYKLLGAYRKKMPAYASFIQLPTEEAYIDLALKCRESGYRAIKIHPYWGGDCKRDIALCKALREALGDDMILMLDPCGAYDRWGAIKVGREIDKLDFYWYEDPLPHTDISAYVDLCRNLDVALAEAENAGLQTQAEYIRCGATDILKCGMEGGITGVLKAAHLAEAFALKCEPHSWGPALEQAACFQAMLAMPNCDFFELPFPEGIMDQISRDVIRIDPEGYVHAPQAPGIGLRVDFDAIDRALIGVL